MKNFKLQNNIGWKNLKIIPVNLTEPTDGRLPNLSPASSLINADFSKIVQIIPSNLRAPISITETVVPTNLQFQSTPISQVKPSIINLFNIENNHFNENSNFNKFLNYQIIYSVAKSLVSNKELQDIFSKNAVYEGLSEDRANFLVRSLNRQDDQNYKLYNIDYINDLFKKLDNDLNLLSAYTDAVLKFPNLSDFKKYSVNNRLVSEYLNDFKITSDNSLQAYANIALDLECRLNDTNYSLDIDSSTKTSYNQISIVNNEIFSSVWWEDKSINYFLTSVLKNNNSYTSLEGDELQIKPSSKSLITLTNKKFDDKGLLFLINPFKLGNVQYSSTEFTQTISQSSRLFSDNPQENVFRLISDYLSLPKKANVTTSNLMFDLFETQSVESAIQYRESSSGNQDYRLLPGDLSINEYDLFSAVQVVKSNLENYYNKYTNTKSKYDILKNTISAFLNDINNLLTSDNPNVKVLDRSPGNFDAVFTSQNGCPNLLMISGGLFELYATFDWHRHTSPSNQNPDPILKLPYTPDNVTNKNFMDTIAFVQWIQHVVKVPSFGKQDQYYINNKQYNTRARYVYSKFIETIKEPANYAFKNVAFLSFANLFNSLRNEYSSLSEDKAEIDNKLFSLFIFLCGIINKLVTFTTLRLQYGWTNRPSRNFGSYPHPSRDDQQQYRNSIPVVEGSGEYAFRRVIQGNPGEEGDFIKEFGLYADWVTDDSDPGGFNFTYFALKFDNWYNRDQTLNDIFSGINDNITIVDKEFDILFKYYNSILDNIRYFFSFDFSIFDRIVPQNTTLNLKKIGLSKFSILTMKNRLSTIKPGSFELDDNFKVKNLFHLLQTDKKSKILSIGIPDNFSYDGDFYIEVHRKNTLNNNTITKSYKFNTNLFVNIEKNWQKSTSYQEVFNLTDVYQFNSDLVLLDSRDKIKPENLETIKNHILSEITSKYISYISGLEINDTSISELPPIDNSPIIQKIINLAYPNISQTEKLMKQKSLEHMNNSFNFLLSEKSFYSYFFPNRIFKRVFHILFEDEKSYYDDPFSIESYTVTLQTPETKKPFITVIRPENPIRNLNPIISQLNNITDILGPLQTIPTGIPLSPLGAPITFLPTSLGNLKININSLNVASTLLNKVGKI